MCSRVIPMKQTQKLSIAILLFFAICQFIYLLAYFENQPLQKRNGTYPHPQQNLSYDKGTSPSPLQNLSHYRKGYACSYPPSSVYGEMKDFGHVCILIRSYHEQLKVNARYSLSTLYHCMEQFEYKNWSSFVFTFDEIIVPDIDLFGKARDNSHKIHSADTPYHSSWKCPPDCGYLATDWAIYNLCPNYTRWLLVTNGDNEYASNFLSYLDLEFDAIGFDWFSRWAPTATNATVEYGPTSLFTSGKLCDDLFRGECMVNVWSRQRVDLGAIIWNWKRFVEENRTFSTFSPSVDHDGQMAASVKSAGWKLKSVHDCLFSHNPNRWANCVRDRFKRFQ